MSELDCKTYSVFEIHPRATPKPSLTSRDNLHGRQQSRCCQMRLQQVAPPCTRRDPTHLRAFSIRYTVALQPTYAA